MLRTGGVDNARTDANSARAEDGRVSPPEDLSGAGVRMTNRLVTLLLSVLTVALLVACGSESSGEEGEVDDQAITPTPEEASETTSQACTPGSGPDFSNRDDIADDELGQTLACGTFVYSNLDGRDLAQTNLTSADLTGASLHRARLTGSTLVNANLLAANLASISGRGADLTGANLVASDLSEAALVNATLQRARASAASLEGADLTGANLVGADFEGADLTNVNFTGADLRMANLNGATVDGAVLTGVTWGDTTCPDGSSSNSALGTCLTSTESADAESGESADPPESSEGGAGESPGFGNQN